MKNRHDKMDDRENMDLNRGSSGNRQQKSPTGSSESSFGSSHRSSESDRDISSGEVGSSGTGSRGSVDGSERGYSSGSGRTSSDDFSSSSRPRRDIERDLDTDLDSDVERGSSDRDDSSLDRS